MSVLRERLRQANPDLYTALEHSWNIAVAEWLGTVKPSKGSYNAYPHLHNLENYLVQALAGISPGDSPCSCGNLSSAELYILLSAILLHDIGRGNPKGDDHPRRSGGIIADYYANVGIPSRELAKSIGRITAAHGRSPMRSNRGKYGEDEGPLPDIVIDPYGEIRQESLAAILRLVDHMDSAYTRVVPDYVVPENDLELLGQFRSVILGVIIDHEARMVKTVIDREKFTQEDPKDAQYSIMHPFDESCEVDWTILMANRELPPDMQAALENHQTRDVPPDVKCTICRQESEVEGKRPKATGSAGERKAQPSWEQISTTMFDAAIRVLTYEREQHSSTGGKHERLLSKRMLKGGKCSFEPRDWLVARRLFQVSPKHKPPANALLAVVMGDVLANARELTASRAELAAVGLPLAAWLIDLEGHLFNTWGEETYEPILSKRFLLRIADGMWRLSAGVFGFALFSYADLAAFAGESDLAKVRRAVHRIGIITQDCEAVDGKQMPAIWVGATDWKWKVGHLRGEGNRERCSFVSFKQVYAEIESLGDPHDEQV